MDRAGFAPGPVLHRSGPHRPPISLNEVTFRAAEDQADLEQALAGSATVLGAIAPGLDLGEDRVGAALIGLGSTRTFPLAPTLTLTDSAWPFTFILATHPWRDTRRGISCPRISGPGACGPVVSSPVACGEPERDLVRETGQQGVAL